MFELKHITHRLKCVSNLRHTGYAENIGEFEWVEAAAEASSPLLSWDEYHVVALESASWIASNIITWKIDDTM